MVTINLEYDLDEVTIHKSTEKSISRTEKSISRNLHVTGKSSGLYFNRAKKQQSVYKKWMKLKLELKNRNRTNFFFL